MRKFLFHIKKKIYYTKVYLNRFFYEKDENPEFKKVLNDLNEQGISFINNFLPKNQIKKISTEIKPLLRSLIKKPNKKFKYYRNTHEGLFRLYNISKVSPASKLFYNSKLIKNFSKYYVSKNVSFYQDMAEIRQKINRPLSKLQFTSDKFHFDDWKIRLKFFLLLTDVGKKNSPLKYVPKSHKINKNTMEEDLFINKKDGRYGFYKNSEIKEILKSENLEVLDCTGKAGTLIIVNTNGIHKGTPLQDFKNPRIQLGLYSDLREKRWNPKNFNI
ncbi:phytanoyl-CoA dioxygenase family protein [Candidatus Pelagibacter ubique]|nr:phytanoyl-CoA dioxygenase family protein [Candidatus Pelagibacter ubique]